MKNIIKASFFMSLMSLSFYSFAVDQTITLHVKKADGEFSNLQKAISETCFSTTDLFDLKHCGDGATNHYSHGPKNWQIGFRSGFTFFDIPTCRFLAGIHTLPASKKTLDIYVDVQASPKPSIPGTLVNCKIIEN